MLMTVQKIFALMLFCVQTHPPLRKIGEGAPSPIFPEGEGGLCTDYLNVNAAGVISNEHFNFNVIRICIVLANN